MSSGDLLAVSLIIKAIKEDSWIQFQSKLMYQGHWTLSLLQKHYYFLLSQTQVEQFWPGNAYSAPEQVSQLFHWELSELEKSMKYISLAVLSEKKVI